jgi:hypothetical protein
MSRSMASGRHSKSGECTTFPNEVSEAALARVVAGKMEAAYARGDLLPKRRKLMDAWGAYCSKAETARTAKVVSIGSGRSAL